MRVLQIDVIACVSHAAWEERESCDILDGGIVLWNKQLKSVRNTTFNINS